MEWQNARVTAPPTPGVVNDIKGACIKHPFGRSTAETHADRAVSMDLPNAAGAMHATKVARAECRRQAVVFFPIGSEDDAYEPIKVCIECDGVHLWPNARKLLR